MALPYLIFSGISCQILHRRNYYQVSLKWGRTTDIFCVPFFSMINNNIHFVRNVVTPITPVILVILVFPVTLVIPVIPVIPVTLVIPVIPVMSIPILSWPCHLGGCKLFLHLCCFQGTYRKIPYSSLHNNSLLAERFWHGTGCNKKRN